MAKITLRDGKIIEKKLLKTKEVSVSDLIWAYVQQENIYGSLCCGRMSVSIGRIIAYDTSGNKHIFEFDDIKKAMSFLEKISDAAPGMASGFTPEHRERFREVMV